MIVDDLRVGAANDRRRKLTPAQRDEIRMAKGSVSRADAARQWRVSTRTIDFIWFPEKLAANRLARDQRGGWRQYYDKDGHRQTMADHRQYKKELLAVGALVASK